MPLTRAKAPISATKKKSLSATTVRTKKRSSQKPSHADGSYLQAGSRTVTVSAPPQSFTSVSHGTEVSNPNQAILSALSRLKPPTKTLPVEWRGWRGEGTLTPRLCLRPDPGRQLVLICL